MLAGALDDSAAANKTQLPHRPYHPLVPTSMVARGDGELPITERLRIEAARRLAHDEELEEIEQELRRDLHARGAHLQWDAVRQGGPRPAEPATDEAGAHAPAAASGAPGQHPIAPPLRPKAPTEALPQRRRPMGAATLVRPGGSAGSSGRGQAATEGHSMPRAAPVPAPEGGSAGGFAAFAASACPSGLAGAYAAGAASASIARRLDDSFDVAGGAAEGPPQQQPAPPAAPTGVDDTTTAIATAIIAEATAGAASEARPEKARPDKAQGPSLSPPAPCVLARPTSAPPGAMAASGGAGDKCQADPTALPPAPTVSPRGEL